MPKKKITFQSLIDQVQQDFSESEPSQAYYDREEQYREIEGSSPIWKLVEAAIEYAVTQTVDWLDEHEVEY
ncbi:hypothetical protein [Anabaena sp. CCY 9910]|uniref:hypothetical protein n=1 Tax=Anabaena sp. CCY 9910 TaxID=3103870 RepID=UPI0039E03E2A